MSQPANNNTPLVLFLPKWYPSRLDPQLGVFIQKHAAAVARFNRVVVLSIHGDKDAEKLFEVIDNENNACHEYFVYFRKKKGFASRCCNFFRYIRSVYIGLKTIRKQTGRPQLVHAHVLLRPVFFAYMISRRYHIPYLVSEHWTGFVHDSYKRKTLIYKYLCRKVTRRAEMLTVVSESLKQAMNRQGVINRNTLVIPNVVEVPVITVLQTRDDSRIRVLTVADLVEKNKNISGAIRAMARVKIHHPGLEFHIVGGGEDEATLHKLAREFDAEGKWIFFYGRKSNEFVLEFLQTIDFVLTNSNIETFSVVTAEALASGKPVVATRSGGPEYFVNEKNGILIPPGDQEKLTEALELMVNTYRDYRGKEMALEIKEKFGPDAVGRQFSGLYEAILNRRKEYV